MPCAFITGITGQFFRQFALTIAVSTLISAFNSLTLSPALAALLLQAAGRRRADRGAAAARVRRWRAAGSATLFLAPHAGPCLADRLRCAALVVPPRRSLARRGRSGWLRRAGRSTALLAGFFRLFNVGFDAATGALHAARSAGCCASACSCWSVYGGLLYLTYFGFTRTPDRLHPAAGQGLPARQRAAARLGRRWSGPQQVDASGSRRSPRETPGVKHTVAIAGQSLLLNANAPNFGSMYVMLDDFHDRTTPELSGDAIAAELQADAAGRGRRRRWSTSSAPPPVDGLGTAGGFKIVIEDRGDIGLAALQDVSRAASSPTGNDDAGPARACSPASAPTRPGCSSTSTATQAKTLGVSLSEVFNTLQVYLGSLLRQRLQPLRPHLAGERPGRRRLPQAGRRPQAAARSATTEGEMVPLGALADGRAT